VSGLEGELTEAEANLHLYRMRTKYVTFDPEQNPIALALNRAQADYAEASSRAGAAASLVTLLDKHIADGKPIETFARIGVDPQIQRLRADLARLELAPARQLDPHSTDEARSNDLRPKIEDQRALVTRLAEQAAELLRGEAEVARELEQVQGGIVAHWEERMMDWDRARREYEGLRRKATAITTLYNQMLARMNELDVGQRERINNIRVVDPAVAPASPVHPMRKLALLLLAAGIVAGLAGIALAPPRGGVSAAANPS
jgi:uncharacterized protein involved in exopolysaccharide biosynthesis